MPVDRSDLDLYATILWDAMSGHFARPIRPLIGEASLPVYRALLQRVRSQVRASPSEYVLDEVDWAAIRALAPITLDLNEPAEFKTLYNLNLADVRPLLRRAVSRIREYHNRDGHITYQLGHCVVTFPVAYVQKGVTLLVVPDEPSWHLVVPACARRSRNRFLNKIRARYVGSTPETRLVAEVPARSVDDLNRHLEPLRWHPTRRLCQFLQQG